MGSSVRVWDVLQGLHGRADLPALVVARTKALDRVYRDPAVVERTIGEVMDAPLPLMDVSATLDEAVAALSGGVWAVVVVANGQPAGVVTRTDLLEHLARRSRPASAP